MGLWHKLFYGKNTVNFYPVKLRNDYYNCTVDFSVKPVTFVHLDTKIPVTIFFFFFFFTIKKTKRKLETKFFKVKIELPIFRTFQISNIKRTKDELFDFYMFIFV